jgi:hypothetical protein
MCSRPAAPEHRVVTLFPTFALLLCIAALPLDSQVRHIPGQIDF